jgi:hypothetical protein
MILLRESRRHTSLRNLRLRSERIVRFNVFVNLIFYDDLCFVFRNLDSDCSDSQLSQSDIIYFPLPINNPST